MAQFLRTRYQFQDVSGGPLSLLTFYWDGTGATDVALVTEAHARVRAAFAALAAQLILGSSFIIANPIGDFVEESNGQIQSQAAPSSLPSAVSFTASGDLMPRQTQALVRYQTGTFIRGRRLQGRSFIPGWTEVSNQTGSLSSAAVTALNAFNTALGTTVVTSMSQRIWQRPTLTHPGLSAPVLTRTASSAWAVQRSRRS